MLSITPHGHDRADGALNVRGTFVKRRPEWNGDLEPVTPLRPLANYAIPAYKSFPSDSNQQPADYKSAALPLRQRSKIGAEGIEPTSTVYKTAALPLDEAPLKTIDIEIRNRREIYIPEPESSG